MLFGFLNELIVVANRSTCYRVTWSTPSCCLTDCCLHADWFYASSLLTLLHWYFSLSLFIFLSFFLTSPYSLPPTFSTNAIPLLCFPPSLHVCALCPAASESVLLQQLFQSKLTQTGSLVPAARSCIGLRGPKAALLLHRIPSVSLVSASSIPQQPRRYHDLTKVRYLAHSRMSPLLWLHPTLEPIHWHQFTFIVFLVRDH